MNCAVMWERPDKARSTEEHNERFQSDTNVPGTFVPNMSDEDQRRWKGKLIKGKDPRVELRCKVGQALVLVVIRPTLHTLGEEHITVSMNGKAEFPPGGWDNFLLVMGEARHKLYYAQGDD